MKQFFYLYLLVAGVSVSFSQNNARLFCKDGCLFKVSVNERPINKTMQAGLLLENIVKDTLYIKVEFENTTKYGATLYLLEKGQRIAGKEFNYTIGQEKNRLTVDFTGMYEIVPLPDPIVPKKSVTDTTVKVKKIAGDEKARPANSCVQASPEEETVKFADELGIYTTDQQRLQAFKKSYSNYCYSVQQATSLLRKFLHDREKIDAAKLLYPYCVEQGNFLSVSETFTYPQSVQEVKDFVEKQRK